MLDSTAQRQKAYLGYGKGLQNRRLPSHISSKVGDDYYQKRKSYDPKILLDSKPVETGTRARSGTELTNTVPEYQADKENMSMEDKQKEVYCIITCTYYIERLGRGRLHVECVVMCTHSVLYCNHSID